VPRKRSVQKIAQDQAQEEQPARRKAVATRRDQQQKRPNKRGSERAKESQNKKHPTVAETVRRNQQIVVMRDVDMLTFTAIAGKLEISEKTAREGYGMYVNEIAPLIESEEALDKAREYLRKLEGVQSRFASIAATTRIETVRIQALRQIVDTMWREIELRQAIGLLPKNLGTLKVTADVRWFVDKVITLLEKHDVPEEMFDELDSILAGDHNN
jgi:hypothetical protein